MAIENNNPNQKKEEPNIQAKSCYRHYKGGVYYVNGFAKSERTGNMLVIYSDIYSRETYARPADEWFDEVEDEDNEKTTRFKLVEQKK